MSSLPLWDFGFLLSLKAGDPLSHITVTASHSAPDYLGRMKAFCCLTIVFVLWYRVAVNLPMPILGTDQLQMFCKVLCLNYPEVYEGSFPWKI